VPAEKRVEVLFRAAKSIRERKFEISAWICYEVGKSWVEADADTAETIDFLRILWTRDAAAGGAAEVTPYQNERNFMTYIPLGVGAVIPPWNFSGGDCDGQ